MLHPSAVDPLRLPQPPICTLHSARLLLKPNESRHLADTRPIMTCWTAPASFVESSVEFSPVIATLGVALLQASAQTVLRSTPS